MTGQASSVTLQSLVDIFDAGSAQGPGTPPAPRPDARGSDYSTVLVSFWYGYDTTLAA